MISSQILPQIAKSCQILPQLPFSVGLGERGRAQCDLVLLTLQALEEAGADYLAVDSLEEGVALRQAGVRLPIMILYAPTNPDTLSGTPRKNNFPRLFWRKTKGETRFVWPWLLCGSSVGKMRAEIRRVLSSAIGRALSNTTPMGEVSG